MSSDALDAAWFYPKMTRVDAEKCLEAAEPGAFVVRPSSQADCLALTHRNYDGHIGHALIYATSSGFMLERTQRVLPTVLAVLQTLPLNFDAPIVTPLQSAAQINRAQSSALPPDVTDLLLAVVGDAPTLRSPRRDDPEPWSDDAVLAPSPLANHTDDDDDDDNDDNDDNDDGDDDDDHGGGDDGHSSSSDDVDDLLNVASAPPARRPPMREAFLLRKQQEQLAAGAAPTTPAEKASATATLRSARNSQAPIDEAYLLRLLAVPDVLNAALMTSEENRLLERLVLQLQLQLQA